MPRTSCHCDEDPFHDPEGHFHACGAPDCWEPGECDSCGGCLVHCKCGGGITDGPDGLAAGEETYFWER